MSVKQLRENALTTLDDMLEFMGMDAETAPDTVKNNITRLINAASSYIEAVTGRKFRKQKYVEKHFASGYQELCLNQYPIIQIESVIEDDGNQITDSTIPDAVSMAYFFGIKAGQSKDIGRAWRMISASAAGI